MISGRAYSGGWHDRGMHMLTRGFGRVTDLSLYFLKISLGEGVGGGGCRL